MFLPSGEYGEGATASLREQISASPSHFRARGLEKLPSDQFLSQNIISHFTSDMWKSKLAVDQKLLLKQNNEYLARTWVIDGGKAAIGEDRGTRYVPTFITGRHKYHNFRIK